MAFWRIGLDNPGPIIFARWKANIGLRPAGEVAPDLLGIARLSPLCAAAVLRGLVTFLLSGWSGEDIPAACGIAQCSSQHGLHVGVDEVRTAVKQLLGESLTQGYERKMGKNP